MRYIPISVLPFISLSIVKIASSNQSNEPLTYFGAKCARASISKVLDIFMLHVHSVLFLTQMC